SVSVEARAATGQPSNAENDSPGYCHADYIANKRGFLVLHSPPQYPKSAASSSFKGSPSRVHIPFQNSSLSPGPSPYKSKAQRRRPNCRQNARALSSEVESSKAPEVGNELDSYFGSCQVGDKRSLPLNLRTRFNGRQ